MKHKSILDLPVYQDFVKRYAPDPVLFINEVCSSALTPDQQAICQELKNPRARISISSGTSTGKTALMGRIALWHLLCFPVAYYAGAYEVGSNTYIGAPNLKQVKEGVWKEMRGIHTMWGRIPALQWLHDEVILKDENVYMRGFKGEWFITSFAIQNGRSVAVAGKHRYHQLILLDEAAGIADEHFMVINGTQTQPANRTLMASQGVKTSGFFYETHHNLSRANGGDWATFTLSSINSSFASEEWLKTVETESGGKDSVEYRIRVLGLFAENENENLLTRADLEKVIGVQADPHLITAEDDWGWLLLVDVGAGEYRDDTVCIKAKVCGNGDHGHLARRVVFDSMPVCTNSKNIEDAAGLILETYNQLSNAQIYIDVGGVGMAMAQLLEKQGARVQRVNWGGSCFKKEYKDRFFNQRACAMVRFRDAVRQGRVAIPFAHDRQLREKILLQGSRLPYEFTSTGSLRYKIWDKERMREKGIKSPDIIDAMSFAFLERAFYHVSDAAHDAQINGASKKDLLAEAMKMLASEAE